MRRNLRLSVCPLFPNFFTESVTERSCTIRLLISACTDIPSGSLFDAEHVLYFAHVSDIRDLDF